MALTQGQNLGPYEIISLTGAGGMGEVYKARDTRLDRIVAIKVLPSELTANSEIKQRFEREARVVSSLNHPNICILHDIGSQDGIDYLVMEYLEGQTLADRLDQGPLANDDLIRYSLQMVDALDKAHRQGLVHRDLKPSNVMLTKAGAKLLDFGLAKIQMATDGFGGLSEATRTSTPLTEKGTIMGTFQYMSPEQLEGKEADGRSDIFAFGAMLYEMVTGTRAFHGNSKASLIASVLKEQPRPISEVQPMAPPMFERIIKQCLAKDADDRWQTAGDLKRAIQWIAEGGSQVGIPRTVSKRRRFRERFGIAVTVLLALATLYLGYAYFTAIGEPHETIKSYIHTQDGFEFTEHVGGHFALSPDGTRLAYVAADTTAGSDQMLWIQLLNSLAAISLPGTNDATFPFWSPDGRYVAFFDSGNLKKILATGGPAMTLCEAPNGRGGSWNKDGIILFTPDHDDVIHKVSAAGGEATPVTVRDATYDDFTHRYVQFLPDGDHFIFFNRTSGPNGGDNDAICFSSLSDGKVKRLLPAQSNPAYADGYLLYCRENILMAQKLDPSSGELIGDAVPLAEDISYDGRWDKGAFTVSNHGKLLYRSGRLETGTQLYIQNRQGVILDSVGGIEHQAVPRVSPDNRFVASEIQDESSKKSDIWIYNLERGIKTRFTFDSTDEDGSLWSPDGSQIAYHCEGPEGHSIYIKNADGTGTKRTLYRTEAPCYPTCWTQDGKTVLGMMVDDTTGLDCWAYPLDSTKEAYPLIMSQFDDMVPVVSPDGRWLAYFSDETGKPEVYVTSYPEPRSKWQVSVNSGIVPAWSRDGKELFFVDIVQSMLMAAEVEGTGSSFKVGEITPLFKLEFGNSIGYSPFNDGQRFLTNPLQVQDTRSQVVLVQNWANELKE